MAVSEINDWDDSVPSCLGGKKEGRENGKKISVLKKNDGSDLPQATPPDTPTQAPIPGTNRRNAK
eukprot:scaffold118196_cov18-Phaeocystis_antarctica.AAC.1